MTPEEKARVKIDQWFAEAGWRVVDRLPLFARDCSKAISKPIISCLLMGKP